MCVIAVCPPKHRPSFETIQACWDANPHGAGIAWRSNREVRWRKTNDVRELAQLASSKPGEIILHFRIASVGGVCNELRHPFPVSKRAGLADHGSAKAVLFQNGTWPSYDDALRQAATEGHVVPEGPMSDARAAAFLCSIYGPEFLKGAGGSRWVFYGAGATSLFGEWDRIGEILYSNTYWRRHMPSETAQERPRRKRSSLSFTCQPCAPETAQDIPRDASIPGPTPEPARHELELWDMHATDSYWDRLRASLPKPSKPIKR